VTTKREQLGRVAFREEGPIWAAYWAKPDTMKGAIPLGSIHMSAVRSIPGVRERFVELMRDVVSDVVRDVAGVRPEWGEHERAPEHERAGSA
jgi:hypothetical protein